MADKKEKKQELCHLSVHVVENGYQIHCGYNGGESSLAQRAGWVPPSGPECKEYVAKTKADLKRQLNEIIDNA